MNFKIEYSRTSINQGKFYELKKQSRNINNYTLSKNKLQMNKKTFRKSKMKLKI